MSVEDTDCVSGGASPNKGFMWLPSAVRNSQHSVSVSNLFI